MTNDFVAAGRFDTYDCGTCTIFVEPSHPFWFVPNETARAVLEHLSSGAQVEHVVRLFSEQNGKDLAALAHQVDVLLDSISLPPMPAYEGRSARKLERLSELWFHLTDNCNSACRHCLFRQRPGASRTIDINFVKDIVRQGVALGSRVICLTGGEPFVHPNFTEVLRWLNDHEGLRTAVLTNGILVAEKISFLKGLNLATVHFQVSLDGPEEHHDAQRGKGSFRRTTAALRQLRDAGISCSVSMAVNSLNASSMANLVGLAAENGITNVHFMWHFQRGIGRGIPMLPVDHLLRFLVEAANEASRLNITIDNIEALRSQVFSYPGTRFDFGNAGWESLAIGPDGEVYPTPAMVNLQGFCAGNVGAGLEKVWRESPILEKIRRASLIDVPEMARDPLRFIVGGGDLDHCCGEDCNDGPGIAMRDDPYRPIYHGMVLWLIEREARGLTKPEGLGLVLRMGDVTTDCPSAAEVNFTHSNCLLSLGTGTEHGLVRDFYSVRAESPDASILNPIGYSEELVDFIPEEAMYRLYGCGSPVSDACLQPGEAVLDLGSGTGVECFFASRAVGPTGIVVGLDMTRGMLRIAHRARALVAEKLSYSNTTFVQGLLENIPLCSNVADVVISNCVVNLCHNKRRVFGEMYRVLKPGGRIVISDVVSEIDAPLSIRGDHQLIGECLGGAMVQGYLFALLADTGFINSSILKRFPYRIVHDHHFFSLTFQAFKPSHPVEATLLYAGPLDSVLLEEGPALRKGVTRTVHVQAGADKKTLEKAGILLLDPCTGAVLNQDGASACLCWAPDQSTERPKSHGDTKSTGCLLCGAPLTYRKVPESMTCDICGRKSLTSGMCSNGHFVCDVCHLKQPLEVVRHLCVVTHHTDMVSLFNEIRSHPSIPMHGPEYHSLVAGVVLAAYRNLGGRITQQQILAGIDRAGSIAGGSCAFLGICGAAGGVGAAFSVILEATPLTPSPRQMVQSAVSEVVARLSEFDAARCCLRDCTTALKVAAKISSRILPITLRADRHIPCNQFLRNSECLGESCPLRPSSTKRAHHQAG